MTSTLRINRPLYWGLGAFALLAGLAALAALFWNYLPYQEAAARKIRDALEQYGVQVTSLSVKRLTASEAALADIAFGNEHPLRAAEVTARYDLESLRNGRVQALAASGVELEAYQQAGAWRVGGLEPLMQGGAAPRLPVETAALAALPEQVTVESARLRISGEGMEASASMALKFSTIPHPELNLSSEGVSGGAGAYAFTTGKTRIEAALVPEKQAWQGELAVENIVFSGLPQAMPPLSAKGTFAALADTFTGRAHVRDAAGAVAAELALSLPYAAPKSGLLTLADIRFPWGGGTVSAAQVKLPLSGGKAITVPVAVEKVELGQLLELLSGGKVKGNGVISGTLPVTWHPDGTLTLEQGRAQALGGGRISVAPEALPDSGRQEMDMVRAALQNFHYTSLDIRVSSDKDERSAIRLAVEGNSPDAFNGRPIKLTVNLTGEVVPLIRDTLLPMANTKQLLKQQEKP